MSIVSRRAKGTAKGERTMGVRGINMVGDTY